MMREKISGGRGVDGDERRGHVVIVKNATLLVGFDSHGREGEEELGGTAGAMRVGGGEGEETTTTLLEMNAATTTISTTQMVVDLIINGGTGLVEDIIPFDARQSHGGDQGTTVRNTSSDKYKDDANTKSAKKEGGTDVEEDDKQAMDSANAATNKAAAVVLDAQQSLVLPGFVDPHIHLDKAYLNQRCCAATGTFQEAMSETFRAKRNFTVDDVKCRARKVLDASIASGTTMMRSHVECDDYVGLASLEALLDIKEEYIWGIELQIAVFAQEGLFTTNDDDGEEHGRSSGGESRHLPWIRRALIRGGPNIHAVGSAPYCDANPTKNIDFIFDIAAEFDVDVDFHLDYHLGTDAPSYIDYVIDKTVECGYHHRVCLGHVTSLSSLAPPQLRSVAERLHTAGIAIVGLPSSDVYMMGRNDISDKRRGTAPVYELRSRYDVCATFATNNVQNLFTFTGDGDMLKIATLTAQLLHCGSRNSHEGLLHMATTGGAEAISSSSSFSSLTCTGKDDGNDDGIRHDGRRGNAASSNRHAIEVGCPADLVILHGCQDATEAIASPPVGRTVLKRGKIVARTTRTVDLLRHSGDRRLPEE